MSTLTANEQSRSHKCDIYDFKMRFPVSLQITEIISEQEFQLASRIFCKLFLYSFPTYNFEAISAGICASIHRELSFTTNISDKSEVTLRFNQIYYLEANIKILFCIHVGILGCQI
jgi:hypothetical protein